MKKKLSGIFEKNKTAAVESANNTGEAKLSQLQLSSHQMAQLTSLVKIERSENSPIPETITPIPVDKVFMSALIESNWANVDGRGQDFELTTQAKDAVTAISAPKANVQLILGSAKELAVTELFSADNFRDDELVIYTFRNNEDLHVITPGQSPSDVSDALLVQLLNGPHLEGMNFDLTMEESSLLVYMVVLDLIYSRQLQAKLQADNFPVLNFNADDAWHRFSELRLGEDLLWCSILLPFLFPYLNSPLTEKIVKSTLSALADDGLLTPAGKKVFQPSEFTLSLAEGLLPMISFASCAINTGEDKGLHLGFVIGLNVNLVVHATPTDDKHSVTLTGMDGAQLSRLLFELGLPIKE